MTSPFHTPSFGDEDFNLPSLTGVPESEGPVPPPQLCYSPIQTSSSSSQNSSPNLLPQPATSQGQAHRQGPAHHQGQGQIQNHQIHAQTFPGFQQNGFQNYHVTDSVLPKFPPQNFDIPDIQVMNCFDGSYSNSNVTTGQIVATSHARFVNNPHQVHVPVQNTGLVHSRTLQMAHFQQNSPTGTVSSRTSPGRESSAEESSSDDGVPLAQLALKRSAPEPKPVPQITAKKPRTPKTKKRKKKDPNEPQKPVSAYALFFRDTQAAIKTRNPSASFGEVSKIVASMWDGLNEENKGDYKKRTELAKKEYLKQLAAYRATLVSTGALDSNEVAQQQTTKTSNKQQKQQAQQQQHRTSPPHQVILPNPAMTTVPMTTHQMTTSISMPQMPGMPLSHMPNNNMMGVPQNPGHMMPPQGYRMMPPQGHMGPQQIPAHLASHIPVHNAMSPNSMIAAQAEPMAMHDGYMTNQVMGNCGPLNAENVANSMCIRTGCGNPAMHSQHCNNEFCSNDCVVSHCRDVFTQWVSSRQESSPYASVK